MIKTVPQPDDEVPSGRTLSSFGSRSMSHLPGMKATLWFSNIELQTAFNSFHRKEIPLESLSFFVITLSCFIVIAILGLVYNPAKGMTIPLSLALYFGVAMVVCGWIFLYCKYCAKYFHKKSTIPWDYYSRILQNVYIILLSLFFALRLYARVDYGQCGSTLFREYIYCNPNADRGGFPEDSILGATIILPMYTSILRDTSIITTTVAYMILSTSFIYTAIIGGALSPVYIAVGFYMLMTAIILYSNQKQNIRSFIVQQQLSAHRAAAAVSSHQAERGDGRGAARQRAQTHDWERSPRSKDGRTEYRSPPFMFKHHVCFYMHIAPSIVCKRVRRDRGHRPGRAQEARPHPRPTPQQ
ncbi:hypothetical protein EON65_44640 [archaeon]|nr:MAG: hypothetical protein EON65_44640 [archaeon]